MNYYLNMEVETWFWFYLLAFGIGSAVGLSELLSKYSWSFRVILCSGGGVGYLLVNGLTACLAYRAAEDWGILDELLAEKPVWRVIIISFLAMAALRSAFLNVKVDGQDFAAGLSLFLKVFSSRAERSLDQGACEQIYADMGPVVAGIRYSTSKNFFLTTSAMLLRSVSSDEWEKVRDDVDKIEAAELDDEDKMVLFAIRISEAVGPKLFKTLVKEAKTRIVPENEHAADEKAKKIDRLNNMRRQLLSGADEV